MKLNGTVVDTPRLTSGREKLVPVDLLDKSYDKVNEPSYSPQIHQATPDNLYVAMHAVTATSPMMPPLTSLVVTICCLMPKYVHRLHAIAGCCAGVSIIVSTSTLGIEEPVPERSVAVALGFLV